MRALKPGGILSVTFWNKEEPPKSVLKLYATMAGAAEASGDPNPSASFFAVGSYLSTATVLYKKGGFTDTDIAALRAHTKAMSFDEVYYPGIVYDDTQTQSTLDNYRNQIFFKLGADQDSTPPGNDPTLDVGGAPSGSALPSTIMGRLVWHALFSGDFDKIVRAYVFDIRPLTNERPYFAAYVKPQDLPRLSDRLELLQDEWGYLLLWATLGIAAAGAAVLVLFPLVFGWRTIFAASPGKLRTIFYFACLGLGYIMVEVGLIAEFVLALSNATVSASILITGMLMASGLGSLASERILPRARQSLPKLLAIIGALLLAYGAFIHVPLDWIGTFPYWLRLIVCLALIFPPAFCMGFPMPTAMASLAKLDKEHMFLWAWGINGSFSVIGAALVPLIATSFGLSNVLYVSGIAYLCAIPAFFGVLLPKLKTTAAI